MGVKKSHFSTLRAFSLLSFKGLLQIMEMSELLTNFPRLFHKVSLIKPNFLGGNCPLEVDITLKFYFALLSSQR